SPRRAPPCPSSSYAYHELAEVLAREEPDEAARRILKSRDHFLTVTHPVRAQPLAHVLGEGGEAMIVIENDEPLNPDPPAQHRRQQRRRAIDTGGQLLEVVPGDETAERHTGPDVEQRRHGVEHLAPHVLEIYIDPLRT